MDTEYWMGISCYIKCEILDVESLHTVRVKPWVPPTQDVEWKSPNDKQTLPPLGPVGKLHLYDVELARPGGPTSHLCMVPLGAPYLVYTAAVKDLGIPYQLMSVDYAWGKYGGLIKMPK